MEIYFSHKMFLVIISYAFLLSFFFKDEVNFIVVNRVEDVLRAAFDDESPGMAQAISSKL